MFKIKDNLLFLCNNNLLVFTTYLFGGLSFFCFFYLIAQLSLGKPISPIDDVWIYFRYARNLVHLGEFSFNLGLPLGINSRSINL